MEETGKRGFEEMAFALNLEWEKPLHKDSGCRNFCVGGLMLQRSYPNCWENALFS